MDGDARMSGQGHGQRCRTSTPADDGVGRPHRTHSSTSVAAKAAWTSALAGNGFRARYAHRATPMTTTPPPPALLHHEVQGAGPRLVMAHGFTQTGRVWGSLDRRLAHDHEVVVVDMPGHGGSSDVTADLVGGALQLARVGGRAGYLGYSMGRGSASTWPWPATSLSSGWC